MQYLILNYISNECLRALFFIFSKRRVYSMTDDIIKLYRLVRKILKEAPDEYYCSKKEIEFYTELQKFYESLNKLEH
jgi:hypothetical protein